MNPKLLLALALVGAMHGQTPPPTGNLTTGSWISAMDAIATGPTLPRDVTFSGPSPDESRWLTVHADPDSRDHSTHTYTVAPAKVKLTVTREPTVTRKADGSWEITFAGKAAAVPPTPPTVRWMTISALEDENGRRTYAYEFGLRSDGCVVWRERK